MKLALQCLRELLCYTIIILKDLKEHIQLVNPLLLDQ